MTSVIHVAPMNFRLFADFADCDDFADSAAADALMLLTFLR